MDFIARSLPIDRQRGFSLLELIIVLAIIVLVAAMSVPMLQRSFSSQKLTKGADLVRSEMSRARIRAMRTGEIHALFYEPGGSYFRTAEFNETVEDIIENRNRDDHEPIVGPGGVPVLEHNDVESENYAGADYDHVNDRPPGARLLRQPYLVASNNGEKSEEYGSDGHTDSVDHDGVNWREPFHRDRGLGETDRRPERSKDRE